MVEYTANDFKVRTKDGEIEITQNQLENEGQSGVFILPEQVELLIKYLQWAVEDINKSLETE